FGPEIIQKSDLAVSAAGTTLWELAYFGVPTICFVIADNQAPVANALAEQGAGTNLGWIKDVAAPEIAEVIWSYYSDSGLRDKSAKAMRSLVDGLGRKRVLAEMTNVCFGRN
ncbi:MAG: glycosyltransferase, partial [Candidatus Margulisbacteria bacterium]|nr:glycosyltransferase [Candidatus Margulisiibacteriota bacterium]